MIHFSLSFLVANIAIKLPNYFTHYSGVIYTEMIDKILGLIVLLVTFVSMIVLFGSLLGIVLSVFREFRVYAHNLRNAVISGIIVAVGFYFADLSGFLVDRETYLQQKSEQQ